MRWLGALAFVTLLACASGQTRTTSPPIFEAPGAALAEELAPDLYRQAEIAWGAAEQAAQRGAEAAHRDHRTVARLWLAAAIVEADRVELERRRLALQAEEEQWGRQLAKDQAAASLVAEDISRYEARAIALREAERLSNSPRRGPSQAQTSALLTRVRLNLALAKALGADDSAVEPLDARARMIEERYPDSAERADELLHDSESLIGDMREKWPEPLPGASVELVETALVTGFSADRGNTGVVIRSERFFTASGQVSAATVKRFGGLLDAFPHGPVACQVAVPTLGNRAWSRRVAALVERFARLEDPSRISTGMVATDALAGGTVQCTFAAYRTR